MASGCQVRAVLGGVDGISLIALAGALLVSFVGYRCAYPGIFRVEGGPVLPRAAGARRGSRGLRRSSSLMAAARFGQLRAPGRGDEGSRGRGAGGRPGPPRALRPGDRRLRCGDRRAGLSGRGQPPIDFTIPWAVIPIPGFLIGFWAAKRYGGQFRGPAGGLRPAASSTCPGLDPPHPGLFTHPLRWGSALCGMALFWAADAFASLGGARHVRRPDGSPAELLRGVRPPGCCWARRTRPLAGAGACWPSCCP